MGTGSDLSDITEQPDMGIVLSDGTRLSARTWMPQDAIDRPVPAILEFLPYRKRDGTTARDALTHPWFAKRGYACIRVDMRGNGDSEGLMEDEYAPQELSDAVDVINWLAAQPWCSGSVGMMGISWGGFNALQVAALQPVPLKAIITLCSTTDRYADDIHYKGGCLLNENLGWGATMWSYSSRAPDPALRPDDWRDLWLQRLDAEPFLPSIWLRHQHRDAYWQHGSVCEDFSAIKAATLAVGGWGDGYKNTVPALVNNLEAPVKGIVGPWVHKYPHFAVPEPRIGFLQEALRWWDHWLKGKDTGVQEDPAYRAYQMNSARPQTWYSERPGRWVCEPDGAASIPREEWHLTDTGLSQTQNPLHTTVSSPQDCGMDGGEYCAIWLGPELPGDQRRDSALSAQFISAPLVSPRAIVGAPKVSLCISSDKPSAQIAVRLMDVHPDGAATRITYGVLNLAHRNSHAAPEALEPGTSYDVALDLDHIAYELPAGHRLAIAVSNTYWPLLWPSPETATLTLSGGTLSLPVRASGHSGDECTFEPPEAEAPWQIETLREAKNSRETAVDHVTGVVTLTVTDDFGKVRDLDHGLINGSIAREWWSIHPSDPLSAHGKCHWTDELERDDLCLRTEARCEMWSNETTFFLSARLQAFENDICVFDRTLNDEIDRDHM